MFWIKISPILNPYPSLIPSMIKIAPLPKPKITPSSTTKIRMMIMKATELIKIYKKANFCATNFIDKKKIWQVDHQDRPLKLITRII
jgi:hypothetical protein